MLFFFLQLNKKHDRQVIAMAGDRTRIDCLEGNHADHYTTIADYDNRASDYVKQASVK